MELNTAIESRIIEMAWEDRTPFEAIKHQFGLNEAEVIKFMRSRLKPSSFKYGVVVFRAVTQNMRSCAAQKLVEATAQPSTSIANWHTPNKLLKRDSQCVAFSACGGFCD